jgi:hypothetical protein
MAIPAIVFSLILLFPTAIALHAQDAPAPSGTWSGRTNGKGAVGMTLTVTSAGCSYTDPYLVLNAVRCNWESSASNGGILTLFYLQSGLPAKLYIGVTWVNRDRIIARLGPGDDGAATLNRV